MRDGWQRFEAYKQASKSDDSTFVRHYARLNQTNDLSARLIFITPIIKPDCIIRPLDYSVSGEFLDDLAESMANANYNSKITGFGLQRGVNFLDTVRNANSALMPSSTTYTFGRYEINNLYRFCLIVHNCPTWYRTAAINRKNKLIYTGWCLDEPISRSGNLNYNCELIFTHVTHIDMHEAVTPGGYESGQKVVLDGDIMNPRTSEMNSSQDGSELDIIVSPDKVISNELQHSDSPTEDYTSVMTDNDYALSRNGNPYLAHSRYNSPNHQLTRIINSVAKTAIDNRMPSYGNYDGGMQTYGYDYAVDIHPPMADNFTTVHSDYTIKRQLLRNLDGMASLNVHGPKVYKRDPITLLTIKQLYPDISENTEVFRVHASDYDVDLGSEEATSLYSIASYFIKTSIAPAISEFGLASLCFFYATSDASRSYLPKLDREPVVEVKEADPYISESTEDTLKKVHYCLEYIKTTIFKPIESMVGDIEVFVIAKSSDDTIIQLQLRDCTDEVNYSVCVQPGDLGGLVSPQIGTLDEYIKGSAFVNSIANFVANVGGNN